MNVNIYDINTILTFKKKHPCGSSEWIVIKTGVEYKLKCKGCGREIIIPRADLTKYLKK